MIDMYISQQNFTHLEISQQEWKRVKSLLDILESFKRCNDHMEAMKHPSIKKVFWIYESLYNEINHLMKVMDMTVGRDSEYVKEFLLVFKDMRIKLTKYYDKTVIPFVYDDEMILDPHLKLYLMKQRT